eukprot:CAMPEP_0113698324 /NCGR_PEP_ID=MMETSP0038_2-20120614/22641_1 /TAXON_ID=2898 /ORGANISM="Cryptomonas paramecium" /LENGTH=197 /DNA_ID=CAMNT_0000621463 /DNA_START=46 /DNA_END=639 /DNA_ORIENTATION=- /assembly_acc=CAM_ASM_000170
MSPPTTLQRAVTGRPLFPTFSDIILSSGYGEKMQSNGGRPGQQRAILTKEQAISIYLQRKSSGLRTSAVAAMFQVNPKTVRDIWNRRTWADETQHLWEDGEEPVMRSRRRMMKFGRSESEPGTRPAYDCGNELRTRSCCSSTSTYSSLDSRDSSQLPAFQSSSRDSHDWTWECGVAPLSDGQNDPFDVALPASIGWF